MPRVKKEETTKKTTKKVVDNLSKGIEEFSKTDYIHLDFSPITTSLIKDINNDESKREEKVIIALKYINGVEEKCRSFYMNGNQFAQAAINLHIGRMISVLEVYEFLYSQSKNMNNHYDILSSIVRILNDILYPRKYEVNNSFGITYENFIIDFNVSSELFNKLNYYNNELGKIRR